MLRLNPEGFGRFVQAEEFCGSFAGGEANVALSLANYGVISQYVTALPKHEIGQMTVNALRRYGVDTSKIIRTGERIGVLYLEKGVSQRPSKVIYDRKHSSFAEVSPEAYNWAEIFKDADWFHFTGITPALSKKAADEALQAAKIAHEMGVTVSCDSNYRSTLWSMEDASKTLKELMPYVDVCLSNEIDAKNIFGVVPDEGFRTDGVLTNKGYEDIARKLTKQYGFTQVAFTRRGSISASVNNWSGMLYTGGKTYFSKEYQIIIVDRIGGGDSFGGGIIYALMNHMEPQEAIEFATAASCLKQTIEGDYNQVSIEEVKQLACGDGSGRVQR